MAMVVNEVVDDHFTAGRLVMVPTANERASVSDVMVIDTDASAKVRCRRSRALV